MGKLKCGCVTADARNTAAVRHGTELGGYLKDRCEKQATEYRKRIEEYANKRRTSEDIEIGREQVLDEIRAYIRENRSSYVAKYPAGRIFSDLEEFIEKL